MTGVVLALAGLTCGDGGPGMGAAKAAPVEASFDGQWEGTWGGVRDRKPLRVEMSRGVFRFPTEASASVTFRGRGPRGAVALVHCASGIDTAVADGVYELKGDHLRLCVSFGPGPAPTCFDPIGGAILITLRPAAPRKP